LDTSLDNKVNTSSVGAANGVAPLNSSTKISVSYIDETLLKTNDSRLTVTRSSKNVITDVTDQVGTTNNFVRNSKNQITSFTQYGVSYTIVRNAAGFVTGVTL
jgi:hypothetical protein